jgi:hypothetical protein
VKALASPRERVPAAIALLNRGWGMPRQQVSGDQNAPVLVDFRWSNGETIVPSTARPVIEVEAEPALAWEND